MEHTQAMVCTFECMASESMRLQAHYRGLGQIELAEYHDGFARALLEAARLLREAVERDTYNAS